MALSARDFVLEVIEKYKSLPCLWLVKHPDYHNRDKKDAALKELLVLFKTKDTDANLETVKKKSTLRNCFKKEHNKVKAFERSGAGTEEIHVPKLWYYNEMLFLADVDVPRASRTLDSILDDMPFDDNTVMSNDETEDMDVQSPQSLTSAVSSSRSQGRKTKAQADNVLAKIAKKLDEPIKTLQRYDSFGQHIAEKLRILPPIMVTYCQKIINDALIMAETNSLRFNSHIVPMIHLAEPAPEQHQYDIQRRREQVSNNNTDAQPRKQLFESNSILYDAFVAAMNDGDTSEQVD